MDNPNHDLKYKQNALEQGTDYSMANEKVTTFDPSTLETIDKAVFTFVDEIVDAHTSTNSGWKKVPVMGKIYGTFLFLYSKMRLQVLRGR